MYQILVKENDISEGGDVDADTTPPLASENPMDEVERRAFVLLLNCCKKLSNLGSHTPRDRLFRPRPWHGHIAYLLRWNQAGRHLVEGVPVFHDGAYNGDSLPLNLWPAVLKRANTVPTPPGVPPLLHSDATFVNHLIRHGPRELLDGRDEEESKNKKNIDSVEMDTSMTSIMSAELDAIMEAMTLEETSTCA